MSTGLEAPPIVAAIENNLFFDDGKLLKTETDGDVFQSNESPQDPMATAEVDEREPGGENLDFTADILDLLLCVQNDDNARQNIESIMDQWDEMNLLNDGGDGSSKNDHHQTSASSESVVVAVAAQDTCTKTVDNLFLNLVEAKDSSSTVLHQSSDTSPGNGAGTQATSADSPTATSTENQQPNIFNTLTITNIVHQDTQHHQLQLRNATTLVVVAKSESSTVSPAVVESPQQAENAALCMKIQALTCSHCGRTYSELMSSGVIPKILSKPYPCPFCRGNYYKKPSAELHMKVHMEDDTLSCRLCAETCVNFKRNGLGQNIDETTPNHVSKRVKHDAFPCLICSASLSSRVELEKHIRSHKRSSNNYRKGHQEKDSAAKKHHEQQKNVCGECKKSFRSKTDLDFHVLTHDTKFTKIVDRIVLHRTQSNILDHSYGKNVDCANDSPPPSSSSSSLSPSLPSTKIDENQNLKTSEAKGSTRHEANAMDIDEVVNNYDPAKLNGENCMTSFNSSTCDITSSYGQPNFSSSMCDASSTSPKVESSIAPSPINNNAHLYVSHSNQQIFVSTPSVERNEASSFITDDSINFDQNLFKTFTSVDTASSSGYDVLQRYLEEQPDESNRVLSTANVLLNPITHTSDDANGLIFSDVKTMVVNTSTPNGLATTKLVNVNPTMITSTKSAHQNLAVKIPATNMKLGANYLLGQNGLVHSSGAALAQTNKSYVVMYVLPTSQTAPAQISPGLLQQNGGDQAVAGSSNTYVRLPAVDSKMTYLVPITNDLAHQQQALPSPSTGHRKTSVIRRKNALPTTSHQKIRPSTASSRSSSSSSSSSSSTSEIRLDPGKLHTAQPPPAKQIPAPNKRNILQLAYDDACKLIEDTIVQKSGVQTSSSSSSSSSSASVVVKSGGEVGSSSSSTLNGNYTLLKQMLNSKPRLSPNFVSENSTEHTPAIDNSFTQGQVTFQYRNEEQDEGSELTSSATAQSLVQSQQHVCEVCQATLSNENYIAHLRTHSKTLYKCKYCQKIFVLQDNLVVHMKKHLQPQVFNCKMCSKTFTSVLLFKLHILVHKGLLFICVTCVKLFNKKEDYDFHLRTHNEHDLACVQCKRRFSNPNCESNTNFVCPDCVFVKENHAANMADSSTWLSNGSDGCRPAPNHADAESSVAERTTEFEDLCFPCPYCDVLASGGVEFKNHFGYHLSRPIKCFVCCEMFDKFALLAGHMKTHTFPHKFFCQFCAKKFPDRESYQSHYHPNFKPYSCMVCEQGLFNQTDLTVHAMNHDMTAKCCCNFCGEQFQSSDPDEVFSHKSSHLKGSIAECDVCTAKFVLYAELLEHISKAHDEEGKRKMAFKCGKCNVFLSSAEQLSEHEQKHLKMDFVCQQCRSSFMEFNELLRHWIKLHAKNTLKCFKCSCCSKFFLNEPQWLEHAEQSEKKPVLLPYSLQQFGDRSFKLEPDTKKTYCCNQCNESFRSKVDIIKHMRRLQHK